MKEQTKEQTKEQNKIPYSLHHRSFPQMVGSAVNQSVFMYLFDEYLVRLMDGKETEFPTSIREIAQKRNMHRNTVAKSLADLKKMGLITMRCEFCTVNADTYLSLIKAFEPIKNTEDQEAFVDALKNGKYRILGKFGYEDLTGSETHFLSMMDGIQGKNRWYKNVPSNEENNEKWYKNVPSEKDEWYKNVPSNEENDKKWYKNVPSKKGEFCENEQPEKLESHRLFKIAQGYSKPEKVILKCTDLVREIRNEVMDRFGRKGFVREFHDYYSDFLDGDEFERLVSAIFDDSGRDVSLGLEFALFLRHWELYKLANEDDEGDGCGERKSCNVKNGVNGGGDDDGDYPDDGFRPDFAALEKSLAGFRRHKQKQLIPFFKVSEVEEIASDIRNCLDRADKMYVNIVWTILHECFDRDAAYDDDGNEISEESCNVEGASIPEDRLRRDFLLPAMEQVREMIEDGHVEIDGEDYHITAEIGDADDFENIIDWERVSTCDGRRYIVSSDRVRNIFGERIERYDVGRARREDRPDDMGYMRKIMIVGGDDERYGLLTPIELAIYNFLFDNFTIGDGCEVVDPKTKFVNRHYLTSFFNDAREKGTRKDDFLYVLLNDSPDMDGCLWLKQRMFSAKKIRNVNKLHADESVIDLLDENGDMAPGS